MLIAITTLLVHLSAAVAQFTTSGSNIYHARATNYGPTDQFNSDWRTGSCRCVPWGPCNMLHITCCTVTQVLGT